MCVPTNSILPLETRLLVLCSPYFFIENVVSCDTGWKLELGVFKLHICIGQDVLDLVVGVLLGNSTCIWFFSWLMEAADLKQICCPRLSTCIDALILD